MKTTILNHNNETKFRCVLSDAAEFLCKRCESKAVAIARNPSEMTAGEIDALIQTTISIVVKINNDPELRK